jgi:acetyltransferase-like isoleucine patch superfamily enzyme
MLGAVASAYHRLRFRLWAAGVRLRLRRHGMKVRIDAPHGARAYTMPKLDPVVVGKGGSFTLTIGRDCRLGRDLILTVYTAAENVISMADRVTFESWCRLETNGGQILLGDDVQIRDFSLLKATAVLRMGRKAILGRNVIIHASAGVDLHDQVGIGERSSIIDSDHIFDGSDEYYMERPLRAEPITLEYNVWVTSNVLILRGSRIGRNALVAAGSILVGGDYPAGWFIAGQPAEPKRELPAYRG